MKTALVLAPGDPRDEVADWAIHPFKAYRRALWDRLGLRVEEIEYGALGDLPTILKESRADVAFVCSSWHWSRDQTIDVFRATMSQRGMGPRIAYLDTFDQSSSPYFGILPFVDLYVKKQLLRDRRLYLRAFETGYVFGEFAAQSMGVPCGDWHFGSVIESEELLEKLQLGWNVGSAKRLLKRLAAIERNTYGDLATRAIDVHYRVGTKGPGQPGVYYDAHRQSISQCLQRLEGRTTVNVAGSESRITPEQFRAELAGCKLCVSPFGWGEVTDRDFEVAINEGALVKPDMSHLETHPDIYRANQTYLPFKWDGSNLCEVCETALEQLEETQEIARRARSAYESWVRNGDFVNTLGNIVDRLLALPSMRNPH